MSDWPRPPLGSLVETIVPARDKPEELDGPIPWVRIEDFDGKWIEGSRSGQGVSEETVARMNLRVFPAGTVACTCSCSMGTTAIVRRPLITNQTFIGLVPRSHSLIPEFLYYSLAAHRDELNAQATGAIQSYLSRDDFRRLRLPIPPAPVQRAIANYLDTETARIDALTSKKKRLRNALRERYAAVVRGELGRQEGLRLKHLLAAPLAYGVLVPVHEPDGVPMLRITDLRSGTVDLCKVNRISPSLSAQYRRTILALGDLVVSVVGTMGRSIEVSGEVIGANLNRALTRVQLRSNVPRSLVRLWFESDDFQLQARLATSGDSAQPTLGLGDMKNFTIGIPRDADEWPEIADRTVRRVAPIEDAATKLHEQERLLLEHRQALITAAVTGELSIPGVA